MSFERHSLIATLLYSVIFVLTEAGQHPKCGKNELLSPTALSCEPTCTNDCSKAMASRTYVYRPTCVCEPGYVRHNSKCIKKIFCPRNRTISGDQYRLSRIATTIMPNIEVSNLKVKPLHKTRSVYLRAPKIYDKKSATLSTDPFQNIDQIQYVIPYHQDAQGYEPITSLERPLLFEYQPNDPPVVNIIDSPQIYPSIKVDVDVPWIYPADDGDNYQKCRYPDSCQHQEHSRTNSIPGYDLFCEHPLHGKRPCSFSSKPYPVTSTTTTELPCETTTSSSQFLSTTTIEVTTTATFRTTETTASTTELTTTTTVSTSPIQTTTASTTTELPITTSTSTKVTTPIQTTVTTTLPRTTTTTVATPSTTEPPLTTPTTIEVTTTAQTTTTTAVPTTTSSTISTTTFVTTSTANTPEYTPTQPATTVTTLADTTPITSTTEGCGRRRKLSRCRPCCVPTCEDDCGKAQCATEMCIAEFIYVCTEGHVLHRGKCIRRDRCPPRIRVSHRRPKWGVKSKGNTKPKAYPLESYEVRVKDFPFEDFEDVSGSLYDYYYHYDSDE
ncbi:uncharacterized protein LOC129768769 [Toxorhynchites rutilus septentrionalis]|uniref:uncharacterized protein LOC129768769 n=1 Tax=Toxorhynchites rutilus septentrionalis TaxID=329112 RepID=UPI002478FFEF|nr:uncharacterized protein LOC129768769 [Toxorhynchites rutilus septentrionalis]